MALWTTKRVGGGTFYNRTSTEVGQHTVRDALDLVIATALEIGCVFHPEGDDCRQHHPAKRANWCAACRCQEFVDKHTKENP